MFLYQKMFLIKAKIHLELGIFYLFKLIQPYYYRQRKALVTVIIDAKLSILVSTVL